jgi:hypothetical protein
LNDDQLRNDRLKLEGNVALVQLPHPGPEHVPGPGGRRLWGYSRKRNPHRRTFLQSRGVYRYAVEGSDLQGDVAFWGEWEGEAQVIRDLEPTAFGPRWLCQPNPLGPPPPSDAGRPQNTDPFVWGDAIVYTACRQDRNAKLRNLGRGAVVLFGSSLSGAFVLDTVLVVTGYVDHNLHDLNFRTELVGIASPENMRMTLEPWYSSGIETTFRFYVGATPEHPVNGMFSFVPCRPVEGLGDGFARPAIDLGRFIKPRLSMQARTSAALDADRIAELWRRVADQVLASDEQLALATRLDLPDA